MSHLLRMRSTDDRTSTRHGGRPQGPPLHLRSTPAPTRYPPCLRLQQVQDTFLTFLSLYNDSINGTSDIIRPKTGGAYCMQSTEETRIERDSMGEMQVPANAYYGASTQRAVLNFPISDLRFPRQFIRALGQIKLLQKLQEGKLYIPTSKDAMSFASKAKGSTWAEGATAPMHAEEVWTMPLLMAKTEGATTWAVWLFTPPGRCPILFSGPFKLEGKTFTKHVIKILSVSVVAIT